MDVLVALETSISFSDDKGFSLIIRSLNYNDIGYDYVLTLVDFIVKCSIKYNELKFINLIFTFIEENVNLSNVPLIVRILRSNLFSNEEITVIISTLDRVTRYELVSTILETGENTEDNLYAFTRLIDMYGSFTYDDFESLQRKAASLGMIKIHDFITPLMEDSADYAPKPSWIIPTPVVVVKPKSVRLKETADYDEGNIDTELVKSHLTDVEVFRMYGPANGFLPNSCYSDESVCCHMGNCRMLECSHLNVFDDEIEEFENVDWFTGCCDFCSKKIRNRRWCVRLPWIYGGWKGCFCSFGCMNQSLLRGQGVDDELGDVSEEEKFSIVVGELIKVMEEKINSTGIYETDN